MTTITLPRATVERALEALETGGWNMTTRAITALRAAMAQQAEPAKEPVAWLQPKTVDGHLRPDLGHETCSRDDYGAFAVYTAPPQRKPLTEEEIYRIHKDLCNTVGGSYKTMARAVERAHGIKE